MIRKGIRSTGRRKALKDESQERPSQKRLEGSKEIKASREARTLKTHGAGAGNPGEYGSFGLAIAVGNETPREGQCRGRRSRGRSRYWGDLWQYPEEEWKPKSGWPRCFSRSTFGPAWEDSPRAKHCEVQGCRRARRTR